VIIIDAILHQVLTCNPYFLARWCFFLVMAVGIAASFLGPYFFELLEHTPAAKARRKAAIPSQTRAQIDSLSRRLLEAHDREKVLRKENHELRRLVAVETNFGRNHRADVQATIGRKP
jgi:hypothetical protein